MSYCPGIGERSDAERHESLPPARGRLRHDCQSGTTFDHLTDRIEAAQSNSNLQSARSALGLPADEILQCTVGAQADVVMVERLGEGKLALAGQLMLPRHD